MCRQEALLQLHVEFVSCRNRRRPRVPDFGEPAATSRSVGRGTFAKLHLDRSWLVSWLFLFALPSLFPYMVSNTLFNDKHDPHPRQVSALSSEMHSMRFSQLAAAATRASQRWIRSNMQGKPSSKLLQRQIMSTPGCLESRKCFQDQSRNPCS